MGNVALYIIGIGEENEYTSFLTSSKSIIFVRNRNTKEKNNDYRRYIIS